MLQFASQALCPDLELVLAAVTQNGRALQFAGPIFQEDFDVVVAAVRNDGNALEFALPALQANPTIAMTAIRSNVHAMRFVSSELRDNRAVILLFVDQDTEGDLHILFRHVFAGQDKSVLLRIMESNKRKLAVKGGVAKDKLLYPVRRSPLGRLGAGPSPKNLVSIRSRDLTGEVLCRTDVLQNV